MKKLLLALTSLFIIGNAQAQLQLSGSSYTQNFNSLSPSSASLPAGWMVAVDASATNPGQNVVSTRYNAACPTWKTFTNGFKNLASANGYTMSNYFAFYSDSSAQASATDRALGVRQTSTVGDSGAAFILQIANTTNLSNFNLSFQLQSLDTSTPRTTTWRIDYAIGATPTSFTEIAPTGTMTTGGKIFSNTAITAAFGNALDNKQGPVWIRIVTVKKSTGSGNRPTTAIDDFKLTWTGVATDISEKEKEETQLHAVGFATPTQAIFHYNLPAGNYQLALYDLSGHVMFNNEFQHNGGSSNQTIQYAPIAAGLYVARISGKDITSTTQFIVR